MPELPGKKVGIIACSGEELAEGMVTRLAALKVLEKLRPEETVTICLPLFLAGGEGDRAFARFYPTIAVDGCDKRCASRGTALYSNQPAAVIVVTDLIAEQGLRHPEGKRKLNDAGMQVVDAVSEEITRQVDALLGKAWSRRQRAYQESQAVEQANNAIAEQQEVVATCACGSGIPIQKVTAAGQEFTLIALPLIFKNFHEAGKAPSNETLAGIMDMVKIYNGLDPADEPALRLAVEQQYQLYWQKHQVKNA